MIPYSRTLCFPCIIPIKKLFEYQLIQILLKSNTINIYKERLNMKTQHIHHTSNENLNVIKSTAGNAREVDPVGQWTYTL